MEKALVLAEASDLSEAGKLSKVLGFFGVSARQLTTAGFLALDGAHDGPYRLFCSSSEFLNLADQIEKRPEKNQFWQQHFHSAFIYGGENSAAFEKLAAHITGHDKTSLVEMESGGKWTISDKLPEVCGPMSGLPVTLAGPVVERALTGHESRANAVNIISNERGAAFVRFEYQKVPVFLSTAATVIDMDAALTTRNFDVRQHFLSAVPVVMYVKWAFARTCWNPPETGACLVIDDPLLKRRYGFLHFQELLELMSRWNFSTSIAFIPWNCRRSASKVIRLFKEHPDKYSLSIHGCDHTGGEFGTQDGRRLAWKARQATERMLHHESKTKIRHDRVMVFPQGVFSETAMNVLKRGDFTATVNTEVMSTGPTPPTIRISDLWDVAVMKYSSFPIFTRRYPAQGLENFAFDILLGKPCLVVIHHDYCRGQCKDLVAFVKGLNGLKARLVWRNLGEIVKRACRQREISPGTVEIEMYGTELRVENPAGQRKRFCVRRRESEPAAVKEIRAESGPVAWKVSEDHIDFEFELNPGEHKTIRITFHALSENGPGGETIRYRLKVALRRYLSEIRDNYITRKPFSN
jgi:hypothetical protein